MNKYFEQKEFDSPDELGSGKLMTATLLSKLNNARHIAGIPFVITSGYRTIAHNALVGGSSTSSHLDGLAVDISCKSSLDRLTMVNALIIAGFKRIGVAKTFVHVDVDDLFPIFGIIGKCSNDVG
jgi:uncharacterized protein YcbK (DUF882 family)